MNLEQLRKQAKELLKASPSRVTRMLWRRLGGREPILANAQLALAREHGYASWAALVAAAEASVEAFVLAATDGRRDRAERLLAAKPRDRAGCLGTPGSRAGLGRRPEPAGRAAELGADPLRLPFGLCEASSPSASSWTRGADPNATFTNEYGGDVGVVWSGRRRARPGGHPRLARGGREPGRRRVGVPLPRGGRSGVPAPAARSGRADSGHECGSRMRSTTTGSNRSGCCWKAAG